jgi:hypothetical protein
MDKENQVLFVRKKRSHKSQNNANCGKGLIVRQFAEKHD